MAAVAGLTQAVTQGVTQPAFGGGRSRWSRQARVVLVIALTLLLGTVAFKSYRMTLPTDGWSLTPPVEMPVFDENLLQLESGLRSGDALVGVDGIPYVWMIGSAVQGERPDVEYLAGSTSTYTVLRGGAEVEVEVPVGSWSAEGVAHAMWSTLLGTAYGGVYRWLAFAIAVFVFWRRHDNPSAGLLFLLESVTLSLAIAAMVAPVTVADVMTPVVFYAARISGDLVSWLLIPAIALHFLLVFPGDRRPPVWLLLLVYGVPWLVFAVVWLTGAASLVPWMSGAYSLANLAAVVHLVLRRGVGAERAQVRWLAFGFGLSGVFSLLFWSHEVGLVTTVPLLHSVLFDHCLCDLVYVACIAIALVRHQLFDIDVIIRRTLLFAGLSLGVAAVYGGLVVGLGRVVGGATGWQLPFVATVAVALVFDPLRRLLQLGANRLVYGYRDEPYRVLASLGARLEAGGRRESLTDAVRELAEALKLPYVAIDVGGVTVASAGSSGTRVERFELTRAGETLGSLAVAPREGEDRLQQADRRLIATLSVQVAAAVHTQALEADLTRARLEGLNAREEARRRLGNDLHDDVGHRLTALVHRVQRIGLLIDGDAETAKLGVAALVTDVKEAAVRVRGLAHQLHPPELAVLGLVEAVRERIAVMQTSHDLRVQLVNDPLGDLPAAVELGVYGIVQEALTNVVRHAAATRCWVSMAVREDPGAAAWLGGRSLDVEVRDDGIGWVSNGAPAGLGVASMRGRAHELGGALTVERADGGGTRVHLSVPLPPLAKPATGADADRQGSRA